MAALLPVLIFVVIAFASLGSILINSKKDVVSPSPEAVTTASATRAPIPTPTPTPAPTPSPTPKPSISPKPSPIPSPSTSSQTTSSGATASVGNATILTYDLGSTTVVTDTANDNDCANDCPTKSLADHISSNGGRAGMNGTYFCPPDYASCAGKINSFDFPVWNNRQKKWINASTLFWGGRGMMVFRGGSAQFFPNSAAAGAPSDITGGIVNYPSLLSGGNVLVGDGGKGTRSGIGFGKGKLFLIVARNVSYMDLANIFKAQGATEALNLDGGGSVALFDGGYKVGPGRSLPNAVIIR